MITAPVRKDEEATTEFFVPSHGLDLDHYLAMPVPDGGKPARLRKQAIHHLARYYWAALVLAELAPGTILDVACGSGYGSRILADAVPQFKIVGGDYDKRAVEHATATYGGPDNLSYQPVDIVSWQNPETGEPSGRFDYIVSFDTIEHLLFRELALMNFAENLDQSLLFSTPARGENRLNPGWEHHKIEYSYRHLYNFVRRFFEVVKIADNGTLPKLDFWTDRVNRDGQEYLLRGNPMICENPIAIGMGWPPQP